MMWILEFIFVAFVSCFSAFFLDLGIGFAIFSVWLTYEWAALFLGYILPMVVVVMMFDVVWHHASTQPESKWTGFQKWYKEIFIAQYPRIGKFVEGSIGFVSTTFNLPGIYFVSSRPRALADSLVGWTTIRNNIEYRIYRKPVSGTNPKSSSIIVPPPNKSLPTVANSGNH